MIKVVSIIFILLLLCYCKEQHKQSSKRERLPISEEEARSWRKSLDRAKIHYREQFNREAPDWKLEDKNITGALHDALDIEVPYLTEEEEMKIRNGLENIETAYNKKFGIPITALELLTVRVYFDSFPILLITRTTEGVFLKYRLKLNLHLGEMFEVKLDIEEWLDFINALYKHINGWEHYYKDEKIDYDNSSDIVPWRLKIFLLGNDVLEFSGMEAYPPNWDDFKKLMDDMEAKIKKRAKTDIEKKFKAEYRKKFGKDISDFELSVKEVYFSDENSVHSANRSGYTASIERLLTGRIIARYWPQDRSFKAELDISEWLDFVNAIYRYKCKISKWNMEHYERSNSGRKRIISITLDNGEIYSFRYSGEHAYPPNWDEVREAMDGMTVIIKKRAKSE